MTQSTTEAGGRLDDTELVQFRTDGYVVRRSVFDRDECTAIAQACEDLVDRLVADREERRFEVGSYVFDPDARNGVMIKWEGDSDAVHGIEPFVHLSPELDAVAHDARFVEPMRDLVGHPEPILFTEKLNLKRAGVGGANPLHRDHPYWADITPRAGELVTAILYLDDTTLENGCLQVVPGSHLGGHWPGRSDGDVFARNEIDPEAAGFDDSSLVPVEVEAGSIVCFGGFLVHSTAPNASDADRRALLFTYQPPVEPCPTQLELFRRTFPEPDAGDVAD